MRGTIEKFRQSSIVFCKPGFIFWKIENFDKLQLP